MRYDDLAIEIRRTDGRYETRVVSSTQGPGEAPFELPVSLDGFDGLLETLEGRVWRSRLAEASTRELTEEDSPEAEESALPAPERLGEELFEALFREGSARVLHASLGEIEGWDREEDEEERAGSRGLRLRFVFDETDADLTEIAILPWELLRNADRHEYLARYRGTPVVRSIEVRRPERPLRVRGSLRVLLAEAAPRSETELATGLEARRIREALDEIPQVEVTHLEHATFESFNDALEEGGWHVVHFMGHGKFDRTTGEAVLCFETEDHGREDVAAQYLAEHLKQYSSLRLVVLNACATGTLPRERGQDPFTAAAASLARAGILAVVAMQFPISDEAAVVFGTKLYQVLARGEPLEAAVVAGRLAIYRAGRRRPQGTLEWVTPVLYLRGQEGTILTVDPDAGERERRAPRATKAPPLRLGIRSREGLADELEDEADRTLNLVEHFQGRWIRDPALWGEAVLPALEEFLTEGRKSGRRLILDLAAHQSLAFATGTLLEAKSGVEIEVIQRGQRGTKPWVVSSRPGEVPQGALWLPPESVPRDESARDVAVAVSVTRDVLDDVEIFLEEQDVAVHRLLHVSLPEPSQTSVDDGPHALRLAQTLSRILRSRSPEERRGVLHFFAAAPNGLLVFLGQMAPGLGRVQLYEYDFDDMTPGEYRASLRLPVKR